MRSGIASFSTVKSQELHAVHEGAMMSLHLQTLL